MNKIGVGFVGAGWMGTMQLKRLAAREDVEIRALLEPNTERAAEVLGELGLPDDLIVNDYGQITANDAIDAVWLVSPNAFHGRQALEAMAAGKHVFCEKPAATSFAEFRRQIEAARANPQIKTLVDYILWFDPMEQRLLKMIGDGTFGSITQIQVNYRHPVNITGDKVWKLRKDLMGDAIGMGIVHALSGIAWQMRANGARPTAVYATSTSATVRGFESDPIFNIMIKFDNGATSLTFGNIDICNGYDAYHNLSGTEGGFIFDSQTDQPVKVRLWSNSIAEGKWIFPLDVDRCQRDGAADAAWGEDIDLPDSGDVVNHQTAEAIGHFIDCIRNDTQSPLSFENSALIGELGWATQLSAATGREVPLPLDYDEAERHFAQAENT